MRLIRVFLLLLSLSACLGTGLNFFVHFPSPAGLEKGSSVLIGEQTVGAVKEVTQAADGGWKVEVHIDAAYRAMVLKGSRFTIEPGDTQGGASVLRIYPSSSGEPIEEGEVVEGSAPGAGFLRPLIEGLGKGLHEMEQQMKSFNRELEQLPQTPEYQRLQRQMEALARRMREAEENMQYQMLPQLQREMERLQKELQNLPSPSPPGAKPGRQAIDL